MRRLMLAWLAVLLTATGAGAECAWVLWRSFMSPDAGMDNTERWGAFPSRQECVREAQANAEQVFKSWKKRSDGSWNNRTYDVFFYPQDPVAGVAGATFRVGVVAVG